MDDVFDFLQDEKRKKEGREEGRERGREWGVRIEATRGIDQAKQCAHSFHLSLTPPPLSPPFPSGLNAAQTGSAFAAAYQAGAPKSSYHDYVLEDILNVVAQLPEIAATIYRNVYFDGVVEKDTSLDYSGNFCRMLGYNDPSFDEVRD